MIIPVSWSFQRQNYMPIIEVRGESSIKESEPIMLLEATELIEKAGQYKGIPYQEGPCPLSSECNIMVYFSILFPSDKELNNYMESIQKEE